MSSAAYLTMDQDDPISISEWLAFCEKHGIIYRPNVIGRNVFQSDDIQVSFGVPKSYPLPTLPSGQFDFSKAEPPFEATRITVSTFYGGNLEGVARIAALIWEKWDSIQVSADPEIRRLFTRGVLVSTRPAPAELEE